MTQPGPACSAKGRAAVQKNKEARIEAFRRHTRDEGLKISAACKLMGITPSTGTRYEGILIERTGLTREQHLYARWKDLVDQGHSKTQAARQIRIQLQRLRSWEKAWPKRRTNPTSAFIPKKGREAAGRHREARIEAFRRATREERLTTAEACKRLNISPATGNAYERELVRRTGLTRREHWLKVWRELRAVTPRAAAAELLDLGQWGAKRWDRDLGLTDMGIWPLAPERTSNGG